jgi:hypothetical protein
VKHGGGQRQHQPNGGGYGLTGTVGGPYVAGDRSHRQQRESDGGGDAERLPRQRGTPRTLIEPAKAKSAASRNVATTVAVPMMYPR